MALTGFAIAHVEHFRSVSFLAVASDGKAFPYTG